MTLRDRLAAAIEGIAAPCTCGHVPPHPTGHGRKAAANLIERDGPALLALLEAGAKCHEALLSLSERFAAHDAECWCASPDVETHSTVLVKVGPPSSACSCPMRAALTLYSNAERESEK